MKKLICILLALSLLIVLSACGGEDQVSSNPSAEQSSEDVVSSSSDQSESSTNSSSNSSNNSSKKAGNNTGSNASAKASSSKTTSILKVNYGLRRTMVRSNLLASFNIQGRGYYDTSGAGITLDWNGASVEFHVNCEKDLTISLNSTSATVKAYVTILVDDKPIDGGRTEILGSSTKTIAKSLNRGLHKVKIVRQSDCEGPMITLSSITMNGQLADPPPKKSLYIEFIGDSNLIGWGNLLDDNFYKTTDVKVSAGQKIARADENQDGTKVYPVMASTALNSDFSIIAKQGAGVAVTYHSSPKSGCANLFYNYSSFRYRAPEYTFSRKADFIVLDIGSADLSTSLLTKAGFTAAEVKQKNVDFLINVVRANNPTAKIIWTYGFINNTPQYETHIKGIVEEAGGQSAGFYTLKLSPNTAIRAGYPSVSDHQKAATELTNFIRTLMK